VPKTIDMPSGKEKLVENAAFEELFKEYFTPLCAWCQYKFSFEADTAKEAVHSGFIKLWENRQLLTNELSPKAYLYKIVSNISLDMLRHEKVKQKHTQFVSKQGNGIADDAFEQYYMKQLSCDIEKAVAELPDQMRKIFELSRNRGLKYAEIAVLLDISIKTVETQMGRALIKLRQKLSLYLLSISIFALLAL
jgi:RNA polymerase sigma-70 factor (ECF subfamily)